MTLDEAILHCEEVAAEKDKDAEFFRTNPVKGKVLKDAEVCAECAAEHRQLAEWLRELKAYKGRYHKYYRAKQEGLSG